jgi:hypothetical protein
MPLFRVDRYRRWGGTRCLHPLYLQTDAACWFICTRLHGVRMRLKCDGTRAETRFCLSAKRMSPFKSAGASVQSTTGSRGVRISGSNAGYTMFRGSVKWYWRPTPFANFPHTAPLVRHRVPSHFNWTVPPRRQSSNPFLFVLPKCKRNSC